MDIPPAILDYIFANFTAGTLSDTRRNYRTLRACCITSRRWARTAQAALLHTVIVSQNPKEPNRPCTLDLFLDFIATSPPELRQCVRKISVHYYPKPWGHLDDIAQMLGFCSDISSLSLRIDGEEQLAFSANDLVHLHQLSHLERLSLSTTGTPPSLFLLHQFLSACPGIRHLKLADVQAYDSDIPLIAPPLYLESLKIAQDTDGVLLSYFRTSPLFYVRRFLCGELTSGQQWFALLRLGLREVGLSAPGMHLAALSLCDHLEHVSAKLHFARATLAALPPSVQSVHFAMYAEARSGGTPIEWHALLRSVLHNPALRVVSFEAVDCSEETSAECRERLPRLVARGIHASLVTRTGRTAGKEASGSS